LLIVQLKINQADDRLQESLLLERIKITELRVRLLTISFSGMTTKT